MRVWHHLNRRDALRLLAGTVAFWAGNRFSPAQPATTPPSPGSSPVPLPPATRSTYLLSPEEETGPFYLNIERIRQNITEGKPGIPLHLRMTVWDVVADKPVENAAIDVWHCDAGGAYSGFDAFPRPGPGGGSSHPPPGSPPGAGFAGGGRPPGPPPGHGHPPQMKPSNASTFLRGVQLTDPRGLAEMQTIYPGWYAGRDTHIHVRVHVGGTVAKDHYAGGRIVHTGQFFFPDPLNDRIAQLSPYLLNKTERTPKQDDHVYTDQHGTDAQLTITPLDPKNESAGYTGTIVLGVNLPATPSPI
jgi:protocatechuate 3,4-dioxygenase beta subunit